MKHTDHKPDAAASSPTPHPSPHVPTPRQARRYCRRLARRHYENFTVASRLLPRGLRQHFANLYAYCRWADDLADESGDPQKALELLDWWEGQLRECHAGLGRGKEDRRLLPERPEGGHRRAALVVAQKVSVPFSVTHPVFVALAETIRRFRLSLDPFLDLLVAFRQDQRAARYETIEQVLDYCRWSANPVGRLVLMVGQCCTTERMRLSDSICTGLQLANFCQDVAGDWRRGRVYLPQDACRRHGFSEEDFSRGLCNDAFRRLLAEHVDLAEGYLHAGRPLAATMPPGLRLPIALFAAGGLAVLEGIRRAEYDVWTRRPTVSKWDKLRLVAKCWWELRRDARKR